MAETVDRSGKRLREVKMEEEDNEEKMVGNCMLYGTWSIAHGMRGYRRDRDIRGSIRQRFKISEHRRQLCADREHPGSSRQLICGRQ